MYGFILVYIRIALSWIENRLYVEGPVQCGYIQIAFEGFLPVCLKICNIYVHDLGGNDSACEFSSEVSGLSTKNIWDPRS